MTQEERKWKTYSDQHDVLDSIVAAWISEGGPGEHLPSEHTIFELLEWSHRRAEGATQS